MVFVGGNGGGDGGEEGGGVGGVWCWKKMEKVGCDGRPRAWAAVFFLWLLLAANVGEEKM